MTNTDGEEQEVHDSCEVCLIADQHCLGLGEEVTHKLKSVREHVVQPRIREAVSEQLGPPGVAAVSLKAEAFQSEQSEPILFIFVCSAIWR